MIVSRRWFVLLSCVGLGALGVLACQRVMDTFVPRVEPAAPAERLLVCYGHVELEHGWTPLSPAQPGRVARILVKENDEVSAGMPLVILEEETARARVEEARAALEGAEAMLDDARSAPEQHELRLAQQEAAYDAVDKKLAAARHLLEQKKDLEKTKLVNSRLVQAAEEELKELEAMRRAEQKKLAELRLHKPEHQVRRAEAEAAAAQARLKLAERGLAECTLKAPQAGTVARVLVRSGEVFGPQSQQPAILFIPNEPRFVRAEVEQDFADRVALGQIVRVQDDVGSTDLGTGQVIRLSAWYLPRRSLSLDPTRPIAGRTMECLIEPAPGHSPLRLGQRVRITGLPPEEKRGRQE